MDIGLQIRLSQASAMGMSLAEYDDYSSWTRGWLMYGRDTEQGNKYPTLTSYMIGEGFLNSDEKIAYYVRLFNLNQVYGRKGMQENIDFVKALAKKADDYSKDVAAGKYNDSPPPFGYDPLGRPIYTVEQHAAVTNNIGNLIADAAEIKRKEEEEKNKGFGFGDLVEVVTGAKIIKEIPLVGGIYSKIDPIQGLVQDGVSGFGDSLVNTGKLLIGSELTAFSGGALNVGSAAAGDNLEGAFKGADAYSLGLASELGNIGDVANKTLDEDQIDTVRFGDVAMAGVNSAKIGAIVAGAVVGVSEGYAAVAGASSGYGALQAGATAAVEVVGGSVATDKVGDAVETGDIREIYNFADKQGLSNDDLPGRTEMGLFDDIGSTVNGLTGGAVSEAANSKFSNLGSVLATIQSGPQLVSAGVDQLGNLTPAQVEAGIKGAATTLGGSPSGSSTAVAAGATVGNSPTLASAAKASAPFMGILAVLAVIYFVTKGR